MAYLQLFNVKIAGIAACVPENVQENISLDVFNPGEAARVIAQTGIKRRHVVENGVTASDLCYKAADRLLEDIGWGRDSIGALVFVTTTPDYIIPPTSCHLQHRLALPESCMTFEIQNGCPGWVTGMASLASLVSSGSVRRALLLCGDTPSTVSSQKDKEVAPLFGDAGTATALEFDEGAQPIQFEFGTRGSEYDAIIIEAGGARHPVSADDLIYIDYGEHISRRNIDQHMKGMDVFAFGISTVPQSILNLASNFDFPLSSVDKFFFHQANLYMNEKIRKKLKVETEKVPYSLQDYGNTSCASIPLTIVTQCRIEANMRMLDNIACAFGIGLAWGSIHFVTDHIVCPELVLY